MNKLELLYGFALGLLMALFGCFLFVTLFTDYDFLAGIRFLKAQGFLGKLMAIGSLLDLVVFVVLLKINKELMARGVVLAVFAIAILTVFLL